MEVDQHRFIRVYDQVLTSNVCDYLIKIFEDNFDKHERVDNNRRPTFTQFNLTQNQKLTPEIFNIHNFLISKVFEYKKKYYSLFDEICFPLNHNFEQFRIKKYQNDGKDAFDKHVDILDYESSRRFLSFMWYLNDLDDGGETVFEDIIIKPKQGSMVIFPPMWMFPHAGKSPISSEKYILTTYLHYK